MKRQYKTIFLVLLAMIFLAGCIFGTSSVKPWVEKSPKERYIHMSNIYIQQYDDYMNIYRTGEMTEIKKQILRKKKEALKTVETALDLYESYIRNGMIPSAAIEEQALNAINKLIY